MKNIIVDLTLILPGGDNGGAKIMTIELIRSLAQITPNYNFILLTLTRNHEELSILDAPNVSRTCMDTPPAIKKRYLVALFNKLLPASIKCRLKSTLYTNQNNDLLKGTTIDLLFYPLTWGLYRNSQNIPTISVIYDLQYKYHPSFFSHENRAQRNEIFESACKHSDYLVCISDFVRQTVLDNSNMSPEKVKTVHIALANRLPQITKQQRFSTLNNLALQENQFLFYPSNFWQHKNHEALFSAYATYRKHNPKSQLKLVCIGALKDRMNDLLAVSKKMGLKDWIVLPGYLTNEEFAALAQSCRALIFPSLYEGFGMPIVEAMTFGKPVLCSNVTSLPEVAGDAAIFFDPNKPQAICAAIETLENNQKLVKQLIIRGYNQAKKFSNSMDMTNKYLQILQEAMKSK